MGGEGVWYLAARYPRLWAAVADQAGGSAKMLSVQDGDHGAMFTVLADIFSFFAQHRCRSDGVATVSAVPSGGQRQL